MNKALGKILLNFSWKNTLIGFLFTIGFEILIDVYLGIGFDPYLVLEYLFGAGFFSFVIIGTNLLYLLLLIKDLSHFLWANILALTFPPALALLIYHIGESYYFYGGDSFHSTAYTYLVINLILGALSTPKLIKRNNDIKNKKQSLKRFYFVSAGVIVSLILYQTLYTPQGYKFENEIHPEKTLSIIDKSYKAPNLSKEGDFVNIGHKLTWFYSTNEAYFDSLEFLSDYVSLDSNLRENFLNNYYRNTYIKSKPATNELDNNINFKKNTVYLALAESEIDTISNKYKGIHLYLINSKSDTLTLDGIDGSLYLMQEAKDYLGNWRNIEQRPTSFCGNSYYNISVPPNNYLRFTVPRYEGVFNTELRFYLILDSKTILYSNSYFGKVNFGQFFINGKYLSTGLSDPYY